MVLVEIARALDMLAWQLQEAKNQLSEVIETAQVHGPQNITRHGQPRAVVMSAADYEAMTSDRPAFKDWLIGGPKLDIDPLDLEPNRKGEGEV